MYSIQDPLTDFLGLFCEAGFHGLLETYTRTLIRKIFQIPTRNPTRLFFNAWCL